MQQPNLILILIDDLGWMDLGCYGSRFHQTPHLDALAAQGMRFTRAYASSPVCSPTRASLMTGRAPARVGITNWIPGGDRRGRLREAPNLHWLPRTERSLAAELAAHGYQTWHVGKWHLGDAPFSPREHGFQVNHGGCHLGHPPSYWAPFAIPGLEDAAPGIHLTDHLTERAIALLRARDPGRPFLLNLWHYAVHTPIQAPPALVEKYRRKAAASGLDRVPAFADGGEMPVLPQEPGRPMGRIRRRVVQSDPAYAALVEHLDAAVGRLLGELDRLGLARDTLVLFTSDNGGLATAEGSPTCNAPLSEGKGWDREGGVRVCQIARWPGQVAAGARCDQPVWSCDWFPTALAAAGLPPRPELHRDGVDLLPLLTGAGSPAARTLCWHFPHYGNQGGRPAAWALRGSWKLVHRYEAGSDELFDLEADPGETCDRAAGQPGIVAGLRRDLAAWQGEVEAIIPSPDPDWERLRALVPDGPANGDD